MVSISLDCLNVVPVNVVFVKFEKVKHLYHELLNLVVSRNSNPFYIDFYGD